MRINESSKFAGHKIGIQYIYVGSQKRNCVSKDLPQLRILIFYNCFPTT